MHKCSSSDHHKSSRNFAEISHLVGARYGWRGAHPAHSVIDLLGCLVSCFHGRFGGRSYLCGERASCTLWTGRIVDHTISGAMAPACAFLRPHVLLDPFCVKCLRSRHPRPLGHVGQMGKWRFS
jgi:hypothetical protein